GLYRQRQVHDRSGGRSSGGHRRSHCAAAGARLHSRAALDTGHRRTRVAAHGPGREALVIEVRDASADDLPAILEIYNDVIATTTAVYRDEPATLDDRRVWWQGRVAQGYPVLVAADGGDVLGFATFGDF